jgi:hypothetical protein
MIDIDLYHKWLDDDSMNDFRLIAAVYNPAQKAVILEKKLFTHGNSISDKEKFAGILSEAINMFAIGNYIARLKFIDTPWFICDENNEPEMNNYLQNVKSYLDTYSWPVDRYLVL